MKKLFNTSILAMVVFLSSCATIQYINVDVLEPALVTFRDDVGTVCILDDIRKIDNEEMETMFLGSLTQFLGENEYFDNVAALSALDTASLYQGHKRANMSLHQLAKAVDVDLIVSLDTLVVVDVVDKDDVKTFFVPTSLMAAEFTLGTNKDAKEYKVFVVDSLLAIVDFESTKKYSYEMLTLQLAEKMANYMSPHWIKMDRFYYLVKSDNAKLGAKAAKKSDWDAAYTYWIEAYEKEEDDQNKAKLCSNIALSYEMRGMSEHAKSWIDIGILQLEEQGKTKTDLYIELNWYQRHLTSKVKNDVLLEQQFRSM